MVERRKSRQIQLGRVAIGGDAPVSVQSMTTTKTADIDATLQQIASLVAAGVDIVRVAVPHWEDAEALVAIAAKSWAERAPGGTGVAVIPGLLAAIVLHSAYNHLLVHPLLAATLLMLVMPSIVLFVFGRSERATREWVGDGLDLDVELLNLVTSSHFGTTRLGRYLNELKTRFPGPIVADMFCLLQLDLELSIRAKGMLLAREQGLKIPMDDSMRARLDERTYLHKSIGPTGLLALRPLQVTNDRDDWLRYLLKQR